MPRSSGHGLSFFRGLAGLIHITDDVYRGAIAGVCLAML
jgi:hypothetical protein